MKAGATKIVCALGNDGVLATMWTNGHLSIEFHLEPHPPRLGIWVWEAGGWRVPTNKEWFWIFRNEDPTAI